MAGIGNNLYPPIINTWMPAFVRTTACRLYFSLSSYNTIEDIKNVQVIISNQNNNLSVLNSQTYPAGIKITNLSIDNEIKGDNKYFITIEPEDLEDGIFEINQFYKVQIRFTGAGAANLTDSKKIASWLTDNQKFFSEWSTVCLIKGIQQPKLYIKGFEGSDIEGSTEIVFTSEIIDFIGGMYFDENADLEKEYLKYYKIQVYNNVTNSLLFDTGNIYTNEYNPNEINYTLKYKLEDGINYKIVIWYTTNNEYTNNVSYTFSIIQSGMGALNATIEASPDEANGRIQVSVVSKDTEAFLSNLTIRRTSSETDFKIWEDIRTVTVNEGKPLNYNFYDYTVKSGVWYKYCAQKRDSKGNRGTIISIKEPVMIYLEDMFLLDKNLQLKIKYDPSISSFKQTLSESKTDTIGSKYPYIRRNGIVSYKTFPISGLITSFCDEEGLFLNKENIYSENKEYYDKYENDYNITQYKDFVYEREFRERVMDFLHDNTVKLFKSLTEGNVLIKLMDVSFTPNQTLGRMLYSFSATAYEVDECSIENYNKYGIQTVGTYNTYVNRTYQKFGQCRGEFSGTQQNILNILQNKYADTIKNKVINETSALKWLRLEFESEPYLIKIGKDGSLRPLVDGDSTTENIALGYIVYINERPIIVSPRGYYELRDEDTLVTSLWFPTKTTVSIDYIAEINEAEDVSKIASKIYYYKKAGQLRGIYNIKESITKTIYLKYLESYKKYYQNLVSIDKVSVEAIPGTIIYLKDSFDEDYYKHIVGSTGILDFYDDEATISEMYFAGIALNATEDATRDEVRDSEFIETGISANSTEEVTKLIKNGVYTIASKRYIYYNGEWYLFNDNNEVQCPAEATIDYIFEMVKGEY